MKDDGDITILADYTQAGGWNILPDFAPPVIQYPVDPAVQVKQLNAELAAAQAEIAALKAKDLTKFEPDWANYRVGFDCGFAEALEEAAKVCETHQDDRNRHDYTKDAYIATLQCAAAIRALKK